MSLEPPVPDVKAGMLLYATRAPRRVARMRVALEDFQVEELVDLGRDGPYPVYRVEKRGVGTLDAAAVIERAVRSRVSFAGLKDKKAIAIQYMSPTSKRSASPIEVRDEGVVHAELVGRFASPIRRAMLLGNRFRITLRGTDAGMAESVHEAYSGCQRREIPNFFGYQRFGLKADTNHRVGRAIIQRDFASAISLLVGEPRVGEVDELAEARREFRDGSYQSARRVFAKYRYPEGGVIGRLLEREGDHLGALRTLPITLRRLFVNAHQAYVFNRVLSAAMKQGLELSSAVRGDNWTELAPDQLRVGRVHGVREPPEDGSLPLVQIVGYAFRNYGSRFDSLIHDELASEGIEPKQFYIKEAEEMSSEGGFRHAPLLATDLNYISAPDGVVVLEFSLSKGEYATILLREIVKPEKPLESGF